MFDNKINYRWLNLLILLGILYIGLNTISGWSGVLFSILKVLFPFILAFAIAYALYPLVRKLEEKGVRKWLSITVVVVGILLVLVGVLAVTLPLFYEQLISFSKMILEAISSVGEKFNWNLGDFEVQLSDALNELSKSIGSFVTNGSLDLVGKTFSFAGTFIVTLIVMIYMLSDMQKIREKFSAFLKRISHRSFLYFQSLDNELSNYLKGLLLFMVIQFFEYTIIFFLIGHPNWLLLGVLACLTTIIPYFGGLATNLIALITASVVSTPVFIATLVVCLIFPQLDGYVISPKVYGHTNNINPIFTIMVVSVGGTLGGFIGIVIALPLYILVHASYHFFERDIQKSVKKIAPKNRVKKNKFLLFK